MLKKLDDWVISSRGGVKSSRFRDYVRDILLGWWYSPDYNRHLLGIGNQWVVRKSPAFGRAGANPVVGIRKSSFYCCSFLFCSIISTIISRYFLDNFSVTYLCWLVSITQSEILFSWQSWNLLASLRWICSNLFWPCIGS